MGWRIEYSQDATADLKGIYKYIRDELHSKASAGKQYKKIITAIHELGNFPMRYCRYEEGPWFSKGIRYMPIGNYIVFYLPDETKTKITVYRIMYGKRDLANQLNQTKGEV